MSHLPSARCHTALFQLPEKQGTEISAMQRSQVTVFDGGMGHLLKQKDLKLASLGGQQPDKFFLVGTYANIENPSVVEDLHLDFVRAGAQVITTNNFAATPWALKSVGKEQDFEIVLEVICLTHSRQICQQSSDRTW